MSSFLRPSEVAREFGVHVSTVHNWCERGQLPAIRTPSGQYRIRREDVERLLATPAAATPKTDEPEQVPV